MKIKSWTYVVVGILLAVFFVVQAEVSPDTAKEIKKMVNGILGSCGEEITAENFINMMVNNHGMNTKDKCFKACVFSYFGFMREGTLYIDHIEEQLQSIFDATKFCVQEANQYLHECNIAEAFEKCMQKINIYQ